MVTIVGAIALLMLLVQAPATAILLSRLLKAPGRRPPVEPLSPVLEQLGAVTVVVPTLNEADRISPCLALLTRQSYEVREVIVVDSNSTDGTRELVEAAGQRDPRFRLITDDPLPTGWVGRPWALHGGFLHSSPKSDWILGIDADTQPSPGLVAGLLNVAEAEGYDLISLSPQFILKYPGELWLQPALLMTLVYRFGAAGSDDAPERVMANGQCFLCRRRVLELLDGYTIARSSFCDDVTLARSAAVRGFKVGFLDGSRVLKVRMYEGAKETWQFWGRSLDLKDASSQSMLWGDLSLLGSVQGLPILALIFLFTSMGLGYGGVFLEVATGFNLFLVAIRWALCWAIAPTYDLQQAKLAWIFWLSPLADPLAFTRIWLSSFQKSIQWRGREYSQL
ncbi:MAG: 2'-O-glycosyltransferase CruG [Hormoscilla sp.]